MSFQVGRFMPSLLKAEIGIRQILIQFGTERLLVIARVQTGIGHRNEASFPRFPFFLANVLRLAPTWGHMLTQDLVLGYNTPILKYEISPHESPSHLFHNACC